MATIGKGIENALVEKKAATGEQDRTSLYGMQQLLKLLNVCWCKSASAHVILRQIRVPPFLMGGITTLCCIPRYDTILCFT